MEQNINHLLCSRCGGKCCQYSGCALFPSNISSPFRYNKLIKKIQSQKYSFKVLVVYTTSSQQKKLEYQLYLRARNLNRDIIDLFSVPNCCMHWRATKGCIFTDETRPYEGLHLVPKPSLKCSLDYDSNTQFIEWEKVQIEMEKAFLAFSPNRKSVMETLYEQYLQNVQEMEKISKNDLMVKKFLLATELLLIQEGFSLSK